MMEIENFSARLGRKKKTQQVYNTQSIYKRQNISEKHKHN